MARSIKAKGNSVFFSIPSYNLGFGFNVKRKFHVFVGSIKPILNLTMGVFIGQGKWNLALFVLAFYIILTFVGDATFWSAMDDTMKFTRKKIEKNLGGG